MAPRDNGSSKAASNLLNNRLMAYSVMAGAVLTHGAARAALEKETKNISLDTNGATFDVVFGGVTKFQIKLHTFKTTSINWTTTTTTTTMTHVKTHFGGHYTTTSLGSSTFVPTSYTYTTKQYYPHINQYPVSTNTSYTNSLGVIPQTGSAGFINSASSTAYAKALNAGVTVGSSVPFRTAGNSSNMGYYHINNTSSTLQKLFPNTTGKYLGLRFKVGIEIHYGWVQVDVNGDVSQAIIQTQCWENAPGVPIVTGSDISLPVQATPVVAESTIGGVVLQWSTESEVDHLGFVIERRIAGSDGEWQTISSYETNPRLKGQGNSSSHKVYQFTDAEAESGAEYEYRVAAVDFDGKISSEQIIRVQHSISLPTELALLQNYPNPFNPSTRIPFELPETSHVKLTVYNVSGQVVGVLLDQNMNAGRYATDLDASNFSAGIYFYELIAGDKRMVHKMHLIK